MAQSPLVTTHHLGRQATTPRYNLVDAIFPGVGLSSSVGGAFKSGSTSFVYDLAPGWTATYIIGDYVDYGTTIQHEDDHDYVVAFFQELIFVSFEFSGCLH
jgi:hypothetical protein